MMSETSEENYFEVIPTDESQNLLDWVMRELRGIFNAPVVSITDPEIAKILNLEWGLAILLNREGEIIDMVLVKISQTDGYIIWKRYNPSSNDSV